MTPKEKAELTVKALERRKQRKLEGQKQLENYEYDKMIKSVYRKWKK